MILYQAFLQPAANKEKIQLSDIWEIKVDIDKLELHYAYMDGTKAGHKSFKKTKDFIKTYNELVTEKINNGYRYENSDPDTLDEIIDFTNFTLIEPRGTKGITLDDLKEKFKENLPADLIEFIDNKSYLSYEGSKIKDWGVYSCSISFFQKSLLNQLKDEDVEWTLETWDRLGNRSTPKPNTLIPFAKLKDKETGYCAYIYIDYLSADNYNFRLLDDEGCMFDMLDLSTIKDFLGKYLSSAE
jgi:hypothetical protein